ncbi:MAG: hypothetical protein FJY85_22635, partial [Deltaproteobacteria bacterium]|nr:hypothetical protein [Deltaproteobacteria bacterium]
MKRKPMSIKRLSRLLDRCFNGNVRMTFVQSAEAPAPTWEDVRMIAFDAYMAALRDVVNA